MRAGSLNSRAWRIGVYKELSKYWLLIVIVNFPGFPITFKQKSINEQLIDSTSVSQTRIRHCMISETRISQVIVYLAGSGKFTILQKFFYKSPETLRV